MRKVLLECSQQLMAMGGGFTASSLQSRPLSGGFGGRDAGTGAVPAADPAPEGHTTATVSSGGGGTAGGKGGLTEPPLIQLYKRAAIVEEALARSQEHAKALEERVKVRGVLSVSRMT